MARHGKKETWENPPCNAMFVPDSSALLSLPPIFIPSAGNRGCLAVFGPLVLATDLVFLLGSEIVLDVESLADLFRGLPLDHVRDRLASDIKQGLDI